MPPKPLVSVILPVYNGSAFLRETVESVLAQDYAPMELIAINDGSTDDSARILESYGEHIHVVSQPNQGVAAARNAGLAQARGEYLAFIDQDDLWTPDKTSSQIAHLLGYPHLVYVLSRQRFFLEPGVAHPAWLKPEQVTGDYAGYVLGAMLAHRRAFALTGRLDEQYRYADDVSWFFHAKDQRMPMAHLPEVVLHKRVHGGNASANIGVIHHELLAVARRSILRQQKKENEG